MLFFLAIFYLSVIRCYFDDGLVLSYVIFLLSILTSVLPSVISCTQRYFLLFEVRHEMKAKLEGALKRVSEKRLVDRQGRVVNKVIN